MAVSALQRYTPEAEPLVTPAPTVPAPAGPQVTPVPIASALGGISSGPNVNWGAMPNINVAPVPIAPTIQTYHTDYSTDAPAWTGGQIASPPAPVAASSPAPIAPIAPPAPAAPAPAPYAQPPVAPREAEGPDGPDAPAAGSMSGIDAALRDRLLGAVPIPAAPPGAQFNYAPADFSGIGPPPTLPPSTIAAERVGAPALDPALLAPRPIAAPAGAQFNYTPAALPGFTPQLTGDPALDARILAGTAPPPTVGSVTPGAIAGSLDERAAELFAREGVTPIGGPSAALTGIQGQLAGSIQDLLGTPIDLSGRAQELYGYMTEGLDEEYAQRELEIARRTAALGRVGMGSVGTEFGTLASEREEGERSIRAQIATQMTAEEEEARLARLQMGMGFTEQLGGQELQRAGLISEQELGQINAAASLAATRAQLEATQMGADAESAQLAAQLAYNQESDRLSSLLQLRSIGQEGAIAELGATTDITQSQISAAAQAASDRATLEGQRMGLDAESVQLMAQLAYQQESDRVSNLLQYTGLQQAGAMSDADRALQAAGLTQQGQIAQLGAQSDYQLAMIDSAARAASDQASMEAQRMGLDAQTANLMAEMAYNAERDRMSNLLQYHTIEENSALEREGFGVQLQLGEMSASAQVQSAQIHASASQAASQAQLQATMAGLSADQSMQAAQLAYNRERDAMEGMFQQQAIDQGNAQYATQLGLENRDYEYQLSRDAATDYQWMAGMALNAGYAGPNPSGAYQSGISGAQNAATNYGAQSQAGYQSAIDSVVNGYLAYTANQSQPTPVFPNPLPVVPPNMSGIPIFA